MSFLQPLMLYALPVIALPIIIHLINQYRYRTIHWAAMQFLLTANRMSRGYARIRQWLILAARTLAITGLVFAVSRPLASGWLGLAAGGRIDTTIILLDRSPSMGQRGPGGGPSKLETGKQQLARTLGLLKSNHWVLIDSATNRPIEFESPDELKTLVQTDGVSASADLPAMLQTAYEYIKENRPSRTEVWICSDARQNDWDADGGRWQAWREAILELPQPVRFHLLAYPDVAAENRYIRVTEVRRVESPAGADLLLSLRVCQTTPAEGTVNIPVRLEIDGARSELTLAMTGSEVEVTNHSIRLDGDQPRGWGRVSIPADANAEDNEFYFVYDRPAPRKAVIVAEDPEAARPLQLAAGISPDPEIEEAAEIIRPEQVIGSDWDAVSLVLWQAPLPGENVLPQVQSFIERGGRIVFFPPRVPTADSFAGVRWQRWEDLTSESAVASWTGDQDLLANVRSGASLPVGQLRVMRYCTLSGEVTGLATLNGGIPLLSRATVSPSQTDSDTRSVRDGVSARNVYFCATTPTVGESSLARDGVVLYVMIQRALALGARSLERTRQLIAGDVASGAAVDWKRLAGRRDTLSTDYGVQAGAYRNGERLLAINRSEQEDSSGVLEDDRVAGLFGRLDFDRVDDQAGSGNTLTEEIWRLFLMAMMLALIAEAALCLPRKATRPTLKRRQPTGGMQPQGAAA